MTLPHHLPGAPGRDAAAGAPGSVPGPSAPAPTSPEPDRSGVVLRPASPADVPEILAIPLEKIHGPYREWLDASLEPAASGGDG